MDPLTRGAQTLAARDEDMRMWDCTDHLCRKSGGRRDEVLAIIEDHQNLMLTQ